MNGSKGKNRSPATPPACSPTGGGGRFAYDGLDRVIHERARLGILASLAANQDGRLFNDLKELCGLTDGNLSRHLAVLADAGFVEAWRGRGRNRPQTLYRLTDAGRQRFLEYIEVLEHVVADAQRGEASTEKANAGRDGSRPRGSPPSKPRAAPGTLPQGWVPS